MNTEILIQNLNNSLMFNLSLSSKELFHSNFLSFLFNKYNDLFCKIIDTDNFNFELKREHKNIDIEILGKNGINYIIENKVKDILQQEQYNEITDLFIRDKYNKVILFSLLGDNLSLIDNKYKWKEIRYTEIIHSLREYNFKDNFIDLMVKDYCIFVENMINIFNNELKNCKNYIFYNDNDIFNKLKTIRIHDLFLKYGMSLFVNYFQKQYKDILIRFGIHRGMGTMNFFKMINNTDIGIQIENLQYRKYSVCDIKTRNKLEQKNWFDKNYRSSRNKPYLTYTTKENDKTFYYQLRDINIKDIEFKELSKIIYQDLSSLNSK